MALTIPTLDEKHAILIALHKRHLPDIDVSDMSDAWLELRTLAGAVTGNHAHLAAAFNDLMPDTATGDTQIRWGTMRGVVKKTATPARKADALRIVGTPTTAVPDAILLNHVSGQTFRTVGASVIGAGGYVDVDVVAISLGSASRLNKGEKLTFDVPVAGLEEEAELQKALDEDGTDAELEGAYAARIASRWSSPPRGGAAVDYEQWALEVVGIASAYAYPLRAGLGTVHLTAMHAGSGDARILTAPEVAELQALIDKKKPVSVKGGSGVSKAFRVLQVVAAPTNVEYKVIPNGEPEFAFDWDDTVAPIAHAATPWDAATRKLQFTAARPGSIAAGHRLIIGNGTTGKERVVEALSGADAVILEADSAGDVPVAGSIIYAGGPLVQPVRLVILALIDSLGTANLDTKRYGSWEGNLRPTAIGRVATAVKGVLDGVIVTPVVNVAASDPEYPDDATIGLITPARTLVRWNH